MEHRTFLNLSALKFPTILVSGGRRGFSIVIGSWNCWRRSGQTIDIASVSRQANGCFAPVVQTKISAGKRHAAVVVTERNGQRNGKWAGGGGGRVLSPYPPPAHFPVGLGVKTELSPLIPR